MHWIYLLMAIFFEVSGTTCMKMSNGFQKPLPSIGIFVFYTASIISLTIAVKVIDISIAYAIWCALGSAAIVLIGVYFFGELMTIQRIFCLALIILGVIGLHLSGSTG